VSNAAPARPSYVPTNPLIVQGDHSLLLETMSPRYDDARDALLAFAELVKSPEYVHTWRITPLSLWNAAAAGHTAAEILATLEHYAKYPIPEHIPQWIHGHLARYGTLRLVRDGEWLSLEADDAARLTEIRHLKSVHDLLGESIGANSIRIHPRKRGEIKRMLLSVGHPVQDLAGYTDGDTLNMALRPNLRTGEPWSPRDYQLSAVDAFLSGSSGGSGVVVLPCGAGKTIIGILSMIRLGMRTLILCTGHTALQQWKREILERTTLTEADVGEYTAAIKELKPVTLSTYQILTWRKEKLAPPAHFRLFYEANWGLVIYDEVHLLPAPIFRETAYLQARRRLGLTATLVREDGHEGDVFALVGPKQFDLPWKTLEHQGWIATARCVEVRIPLADEDRFRYASSSPKVQYTIASRNARKGAALEKLLHRHPNAQILVLGTDLEQLDWLSRRFKIPMVSGVTPAKTRDEMFEAFRRGETRVLALSRVGNFSVDLPDASVAIQVSGTFGSRQEEAQRLGRVLRPKKGENQAYFYTLVTSDSREQEFAERRQLFLTEQGYPYRIEIG
jgi:DNA excision repair protein ERCC-3